MGFEFKKLNKDKINGLYLAICCRDLYMVECRGKECPYYSDKYMPYERCDIGQLREDFKEATDALRFFLDKEKNKND